MEDDDNTVQRLRNQLDRAAAIRAQSRVDPQLAASREKLRVWQAARLARTHADLLQSRRFAPAAEFFLSDIYAAKDLGHRDEQIERVLPALIRLVPVGGLETVADALELDALSEDLDMAMLDALKKRVASLDAPTYGRAYRKVGRRADRERQIALIRHLGQSLERLTRAPFVSSALRMMRRPARIAGLGELQIFLERGYSAFRKLGPAQEFLDIVTGREQALLEALFAGDDRLLDGAVR
jgi:hypothetical protein